MTNKHCPQCGKELKQVFLNSLFLNEDQLQAMRAGDFYCEHCPSNDRGRKPLCYWWAHEIQATKEQPNSWLQVFSEDTETHDSPQSKDCEYVANSFGTIKRHHDGFFRTIQALMLAGF